MLIKSSIIVRFIVLIVDRIKYVPKEVHVTKRCLRDELRARNEMRNAWAVGNCSAGKNIAVHLFNDAG